MVECLERYPGRFRAIGLVDPESPANARDLERWMAQGLAGFRFHPLYYDREPRGAWWVDAPEHDDLWAAAAATGAVLQFHMLPQHAPALARMIERHPQVRVIVDHIGKPDVTEAPPYPGFDPVLRLADYPHVYAKIGDYQIASQQAFPWADTWPFVRRLADRFGAGRMLWGTGYPRTARLVPLAAALRYIEQELPLTPTSGGRFSGTHRPVCSDSLPPSADRCPWYPGFPGLTWRTNDDTPRGPVHHRPAPYQALLSAGLLLRPSAAAAVSQLWRR